MGYLRIHPLPAFERVTPAVPPAFNSYPLSLSAVLLISLTPLSPRGQAHEVKVIAGGMDYFVAFVQYSTRVGRVDPDVNYGIFRQAWHVPVVEHLAT